MPLYDYRCPVEDCATKAIDVCRPVSQFAEFVEMVCPVHGRQPFSLMVTPPYVDDWCRDDSEGRYFEHLAPRGMRFRDKRSYREHLRRNGLVEWSPQTGMPGSGI